MKKIRNFMMLALAVAMVFATSCKKNDDLSSSKAPKAVKTIAASYSTKINDLKALPGNGTRTWTMYAKNSSFYGTQFLALVKGDEFITGSAAYNFWSTAGNNPVTFDISQAVYSNLTPDEDLRLVTETRLEKTNPLSPIAYLGVIDFNPGKAQFPLTINSFRLGDILQINADALTNKPGGQNLVIKVKFNKKPIDLTATETQTSFTGVNVNAPGGQEFKWDDIKYGSQVAVAETTIGTGLVTLLDNYVDKVFDVTITITETGSGLSVEKNVTAFSAGQGMKLVLSTDKIGWYDSATMGFNDKDITVTQVTVPIN